MLGALNAYVQTRSYKILEVVTGVTPNHGRRAASRRWLIPCRLARHRELTAASGQKEGPSEVVDDRPTGHFPT